MSSRLEELTARRRLLQARCAAQRGEIGAIQVDIDAGAVRADRAIDLVRRCTPFLLVAGAVTVVAIGPGRVFGLARQALPVALLASRAYTLLR